MKTFMNIKTPSSIYMWWNFGSILSAMMMIQIISGIILSTNYMIMNNVYESSINIYMNMNFGWLMRMLHSNTTSMIFIMMIIHMSRSLMFKSYKLTKMWTTGMMMMMMIMLESFIGYSLIWNQMSYWAMMVITNFISAIPLIGKKAVMMIWGNFNINIILINRFLTLHFLIPMLIMVLMLMHLMFLHINKSNNPMGLKNKTDMIKLMPTSISKDLTLLSLSLLIMMNLMMFSPNLFSNNDSFMMMNYFKTPSHIEPEWYFMFFYSILRSINSKLNGLMMMLLSMLMLAIMPLITKKNNQYIEPFYKLSILAMFTIMTMMSMLSKKNIEYPFKQINMTLMYLYFLNFMIMSYHKSI